LFLVALWLVRSHPRVRKLADQISRLVPEYMVMGERGMAAQRSARSAAG
jgi:hypothetical protein